MMCCTHALPGAALLLPHTHSTAQARLYWGGLRVVAVDARRGVVSRRPKFVFFMLAGPAVPVRIRTRGLLDMGALAAVLQVRYLVITP